MTFLSKSVNFGQMPFKKRVTIGNTIDYCRLEHIWDKESIELHSLENRKFFVDANYKKKT